MKKILVIHGPNLNMLGVREPGIYGGETLEQINAAIQEKAAALGVTADIYQSNIEGELVTAIQNARGIYGGIIINPAAYTHTSVAIRDALSAAALPAIEVHISNIHRREEFRRVSLTAPVTVGQIVGLGTRGYLLALEALAGMIK